MKGEFGERKISVGLEYRESVPLMCTYVLRCNSCKIIAIGSLYSVSVELENIRRILFEKRLNNHFIAN